MKRTSTALIVLVLLALGLTGAAAKRKPDAPAAGGGAGAPAHRPTLDELAGYTETERLADGTVLWKRTFKHPIPYDEYLAALAAEERPIAGPTAAPLAPSPASGAPSANLVPMDTLATCTPPDDDYDGDGFTLGTPMHDEPPLLRGEYIADRPRVRGSFTSIIKPGIDVLYTATNQIVFEHSELEESSLEVKTSVKETREFSKKFNGSLGIKLASKTGEDCRGLQCTPEGNMLTTRQRIIR